MEAAGTSAASENFYQIALRCNPEDRCIQLQSPFTHSFTLQISIPISCIFAFEALLLIIPPSARVCVVPRRLSLSFICPPTHSPLFASQRTSLFFLSSLHFTNWTAWSLCLSDSVFSCSSQRCCFPTYSGAVDCDVLPSSLLLSSVT